MWTFQKHFSLQDCVTYILDMPSYKPCVQGSLLLGLIPKRPVPTMHYLRMNSPSPPPPGLTRPSQIQQGTLSSMISPVVTWTCSLARFRITTATARIAGRLVVLDSNVGVAYDL